MGHMPRLCGSRDLCIYGNNCLMPEHSAHALSAACLEALNSNSVEINLLQKNSRIMAELQNLDRERKSYLGILESLACAAV